MTRRPHKKSRKGCLQCKQRHVKCDETHPACLLCIGAEKTCSFLKEVSSAAASPRVQLQEASPVSTPTSRYTVSAPSPAVTESVLGLSPTSYATSEQSIVNIVHLDLLHHARSAISNDESLGLHPKTGLDVYDVIADYALKIPFLMHEILAVSALHLSTLRPNQRLFLRHTATELQTHALSLFNAASNDESIESVTARFLFASILGKHVFYETLIYRPADFSLFLEKFISYLRLNRGVHIQIQGHWPTLLETGLRPLLLMGDRLPPEDSASAPECEALEALLESADLGPSSIQTYQQALKRLKALFHLNRSTDSQDVQAMRSLIFSWPITMSNEFVDLIMQRRPEALAILAHYAGLLNHSKELWIIGDGALYMVESIVAYLGAYWEPWLKWPRSLVQT